MDEFFQAVSHQFAQQRGERTHAAAWLLASLALFLCLWVLSLVLRWRTARRDFRAFAARHSIGAREQELVVALARREKLAPLELLEQVDRFETATAKALEGPGPEARAELISNLRSALGYDQLPKYIPLHSSRELPVGTAVQIGHAVGKLVQRTELKLVLQLAAFPECKPGLVLPIEVPLARDAPYRLHCALLDRSGAEKGPVRLACAHDEMPVHMASIEPRIPVQGAILLRSALIGDLQVSGPVSHERPLPDHDRTAQLLEAGTHDLLVSSESPLQLGHQFDCSFSIGAQRFQHLRAIVSPAEPRGGHAHLAHLEFRGLSDRERARLRAAVVAKR